MRILLLVCMFFLNGCSVFYFGGGDTDSSDLTVFPDDAYGFETEIYTNIRSEVRESCTEISSYHYSEGGMLAPIGAFISFFCIDCKPHSIFKKAVRDANLHNGNLILTSSGPQHGEYWLTEVSSHKCSVELVEKAKLRNIRVQNRMSAAEM